MKTITHILHQAKVKNKCPECYFGDGLEFTFSQEELENRFYKNAAKEIIEKLYCHNCKQQVYPVNWDEDIERVYEYHKKQVIPKKSTPQLKNITYIIALIVIAAIGGGIYYATAVA